MPLTVVSGAWGPRRAEYAGPFVEAFHAHWGAEVRLQLFTDQAVRLPELPGRLHMLNRSIGAECPGYLEFMARHMGSPRAAGREVSPKWKEKDRRLGYNWRFDAVKFAGQAFVPEAAARDLEDGDVLCWLDADVIAFRHVPEGFIESLIGSDDGAYLGRAPKHSEIGFWAIRINDGARRFLRRFADLYREDAIFELKEWHSAFVWDHARRWAEAEGLIRMRDLTPGGSGHVWFQSPLRSCLDHLKGNRKAAGRSKERR